MAWIASESRPRSTARHARPPFVDRCKPPLVTANATSSASNAGDVATASTERSPRPKLEAENVRPPLDERKIPPAAVPARTTVSPAPSMATAIDVTATGPCQKSTAPQVTPPFVLRITPLPSVPAHSVRSLAYVGDAARACTYGLVSPALRASHVPPPSIDAKHPAVVPAKVTGPSGPSTWIRARIVPPQPRTGPIGSQRPSRGAEAVVGDGVPP